MVKISGVFAERVGQFRDAFMGLWVRGNHRRAGQEFGDQHVQVRVGGGFELTVLDEECHIFLHGIGHDFGLSLVQVVLFKASQRKNYRITNALHAQPQRFIRRPPFSSIERERDCFVAVMPVCVAMTFTKVPPSGITDDNQDKEDYSNDEGPT